MNPLGLRGQGARWAARGTTAPTGGTVLDIKGTDTYGKIKTNGVGLFSVEGVTFTDSAGTTTPFIYTTNTTLHLVRNAFIGSKNGILCDQDVIICGGPNQVEGGSGWTDGFQGYGTIIRDNYFNHTRRAVYGRAFCNGVVIRDNTIWNEAGSNLADGAAIEINGRPTTGSQKATGNVITDNLIEVPSYPYGIKLDYAAGNPVSDNNFYDPSATTIAYIRTEAQGYGNPVTHGYFDASKPGISEATPTVSLIINPFEAGGDTTYPWPPLYCRGLKTDGLYNGGAGAPEIVFNASQSLPPSLYVINASTPNGLVVANAGALCLVSFGGGDTLGATLWMKAKDSVSNTGWVPVGTMAPLGTKTVDYTITANDSIVVANGTSLTMYLPPAVTAQAGRKYTVKNTNASACTVASAGGTIDGAATASLAQWAKGTYVSDGANWLTI